MAKPERHDPNPRAYVPRVHDTVTVNGVLGRLVVLGVDKAKQTAIVGTATLPVISYTVRWSELSHLDESQNALRIVREATEE